MKIDREEVKQLVKQGKTVKEIAVLYNKTQKAIEMLFWYNGIKINEIKEEIYKELFDQGLRNIDIMKILSKNSYVAIHNARKRYKKNKYNNASFANSSEIIGVN